MQTMREIAIAFTTPLQHKKPTYYKKGERTVLL